MMPDPSLVSVIVPTYNSARYLDAALQSVAVQAYRPIEVIVIDDGSTDETPAIVDAFFRRTGLPGVYRYQPNQGPASARNHGIDLAGGAWFAFQDADDVWVQTKTAHQLRVLAAYPAAGMVWGTVLPFAGDSVPALTPADAASMGVTMCLLQCMLVRREVMDEIGGFDPTLRIGEDVEWIMRAMERSIQIAVDHEPAVYYRRHAANLTGDGVATQRAFHYVLKRALDRRRRSGIAGVSSSLVVLPRQAVTAADG